VVNGAGEKISGYFGATTHGYNSQVLEGMCPDLGQWTEMIVKGFGLEANKVVKFMVYEAGRGLFPLHHDEPHVLNKFRVPISFSPEMPNFAMRFRNTSSVFEIRRGPLALIVLDMHAAGRHNGRGQRGLIEHGTLQQSTHDAVFFVFDVEAANWAEMLQKNIAFVALLSRFSVEAQGWTATVEQTQKPWAPETDCNGEQTLKYLYQFTSIKTGAAIKTTLAIAAGLVKSSSSAVVVV
jgi:hypothetical protein